jgi:hypothetical protein
MAKAKMPGELVSQTRVQPSYCVVVERCYTEPALACVNHAEFVEGEHDKLRKLGEWCIQASKWLAAESKKPKAKETT